MAIYLYDIDIAIAKTAIRIMIEFKKKKKTLSRIRSQVHHCSLCRLFTIICI